MKYNKHIWSTLFFSVLLSLCLSSYYFTPIHTKSISDNSASGDVRSNKSTQGTITKGGITYRKRADGYYDVIAYDRNIPTPETNHLQLVKMDITKVPSEFAAAQPERYVATIAEGVFQDTTFSSIVLSGDIAIGAHTFENTIITSEDSSSLVLGKYATIGEYAFKGATFNTNLSATACSVGDYAFAGTRLASFTLPNQVTALGIGAFPNIDELTIIIPDTLTSIEAFHLESLTNVTFGISYSNPAYLTLKKYNLKTQNTAPSSVDTPANTPLSPEPEIPSSAATEGHSSIIPEPEVSPQTTQNTNTSPVGTLVTQKNAVYKITETSTASFVKPTNKKITSLTIPASIKVSGKKYKITKVAAKACLKCTKLKRVTLGNNITTIGTSAFAQCSSLENITFGKNVKILGKRVLYRDKKIKKIRFQSKKIKSIGKETFYQVPKSVNIEVPISKVSQYSKLINNAK